MARVDLMVCVAVPLVHARMHWMGHGSAITTFVFVLICMEMRPPNPARRGSIVVMRMVAAFLLVGRVVMCVAMTVLESVSGANGVVVMHVMMKASAASTHRSFCKSLR